MDHCLNKLLNSIKIPNAKSVVYVSNIGTMHRVVINVYKSLSVVECYIERSQARIKEKGWCQALGRASSYKKFCHL